MLIQPFYLIFKTENINEKQALNMLDFDSNWTWVIVSQVEPLEVVVYISDDTTLSGKKLSFYVLAYDHDDGKRANKCKTIKNITKTITG